MTALPLFPDLAAALPDGRCYVCGGRTVVTRTADPYEDDWRCTGCGTSGNVSWSRVFGERAEAQREVRP